MTHSIAWDRVAHADVLSAIEEYDELEPEQFSLEAWIRPDDDYNLVMRRDAFTRRKRLWARAYEIATGERLASGDFESGEERRRRRCSGSSDSPSSRDDQPRKCDSQRLRVVAG